MSYGLTEWEAEEINAPWRARQKELKRAEEMRIQALGAAISRRDWHAAETAYNAIRDRFYEIPTPPDMAKDVR